jgi:capsular polysaccharide transport system permease protein
MSSGVITVAVRAFSPGDALRVAQAVLASSQALVNQMSAQARQNALAYAEQTAADASRQLLADEGRLAVYRNKYAVLYPELSAQSGASVDDQLTAQLSEDQATLASLQSEGQTENSPQIRTLRANIAAIRAQIDRIAATIAAAKPGATQSLASVVSGYDALTAAAAIDQQLYNSDLLALQNARNKAAEESIYLETFVQPSQPQSSIYPQRGLLICEIAFAGFILWVLSILLINTIRDQTD